MTHNPISFIVGSRPEDYTWMTNERNKLFNPMSRTIRSQTDKLDVKLSPASDPLLRFPTDHFHLQTARSLGATFSKQSSFSRLSRRGIVQRAQPTHFPTSESRTRRISIFTRARKTRARCCCRYCTYAWKAKSCVHSAKSAGVSSLYIYTCIRIYMYASCVAELQCVFFFRLERCERYIVGRVSKFRLRKQCDWQIDA